MMPGDMAGHSYYGGREAAYSSTSKAQCTHSAWLGRPEFILKNIAMTFQISSGFIRHFFVRLCSHASGLCETTRQTTSASGDPFILMW